MRYARILSGAPAQDYVWFMFYQSTQQLGKAHQKVSNKEIFENVDAKYFYKLYAPRLHKI